MDLFEYLPRGAAVVAVEVTNENWREVAAWCGGRLRLTSEGGMWVLVSANGTTDAFGGGHYVYKLDGKFYVHKARDFHDLYVRPR